MPAPDSSARAYFKIKDRIPQADVQKVSAALQKQASRDLAPIWEIFATVNSFDKLEDVPTGYWPIIVRDDINTPGAGGIHEDKNGQPFALVQAGIQASTNRLSPASHEAMEMLVDPFGNRLVAGNSPKAGQGRVSFLVEVCDPSEASDYAYSSNGVLVSDFYTPHYFDPVEAPGVRYSYTGAITEPREALKGGYLSWEDPVSGNWWQQTWFDTPKATFRNIGPIDQKAAGNLRAAIDRLTSENTIKACRRGRQVAEKAGARESILANRPSPRPYPCVNRSMKSWVIKGKSPHPTITERRVGTDHRMGPFR